MILLSSQQRNIRKIASFNYYVLLVHFKIFIWYKDKCIQPFFIAILGAFLIFVGFQ